jgi:hypothetical protein
VNDLRAGQAGDLTVPDPATGGERTWTMVQELKDLGVTHVKIWVSWFELAQRFLEEKGHIPRNFEEQAQYMESSRGYRYRDSLSRPLIEYLDESIELANREGFKVILTVEQEAPTWTWTNQAFPDIYAPATREPGTEKECFRHFPNDLGTNSPYGWFIRYLLARYTGEDTGGPGCGCVPARGNPSRAIIDFIEPINEPNYEWWPQGLGPDGPRWAVCAAQIAMTTCEFWASYYVFGEFGGQPPAGYRPVTLGPATADKRDPMYCDVTQGKSACSFSQPAGQYSVFNMGYEQFTDELLSSFQNWEPLTEVRWSHHNYKDIDNQEVLGVGRVQALLFIRNFLPARYPPPRDVWVTEAASRVDGYFQSRPGEDAAARAARQEEEQDTQSRQVNGNFERMRNDLPDPVTLWTQHLVMDTGCETTSYGIREPWRRNADGSLKGPGAKRDVWHTLKAAPNNLPNYGNKAQW